MNGAPDEIELHPAVGECLTRLRADLAASEARCDFLRATVREYLAAEASVAYELADDSDAGYPAAMLARMHAARTRRDEALARLRALAHLTGSIVHTDSGTMTVDGDAGVYAHGATADAAVVREALR